MKIFRHSLTVTANSKDEFFNITAEVQECIRRNSVSDGIVVVSACDSGSALFLGRWNNELREDFLELLSDIVNDRIIRKYPKEQACAYLKSILTGNTVSAAITDGRIELGAEQQLIYADFDAGDNKTIVIKIIGE